MNWNSEFKTDICMWMFIATLFITMKKWKQSKFPSICEQIHKMWYIHIIECDSTRKWTSNTCYHMEPLKHNSAWNKPDIKGQMIF